MIEDLAITIKPTLTCNMHCKHCFNGECMNNPEMLPIRDALKIIDVASEDHSCIRVTFHGGEPSLMGYDFFDEFYNFEKEINLKKHTKFLNYFTTNGLLLDEKLINLLKTNNAMINISFDGLFNDVLRYDTDRVYANILRTKDIGAKMRIFCTLTAKSIEYFKDLYEWFNEHELDFKIAPLEPWGYATKYPELLLNPDEYISALMNTYRYWIKDKLCKIKFYTFEEFMSLRAGHQFKYYWFNHEIALNPNGKLYPFGRPNDVHYCLGTPYCIEKISDCFSTQQYKSLLTKLENSRNSRCTNCKSYGICKGTVANMTYMYVSDEKLVDDRCYIANKIFQNVLSINDEIRKHLSNENFSEYNPVVVKYFADCSFPKLT